MTKERRRRGVDADHIHRHIGERIRERRTQLGLSIRDMAERLGLTRQQVQKYETAVTAIKAGTLMLLADILEVPVGYFYQGLDDVARQAPEEDRDWPKLLRYWRAMRNPTLRATLIATASTLAASES